MNINKLNSALNYTLNKFCPILFVGLVCFLGFGLDSWEPYVILGLVAFTQSFHYRAGYSVAICEERGLIEKWIH